MPPQDMTPSRGFSFTDHALGKPGQPLPGDRLDTELDRILNALKALVSHLNVSLDGDGKLRGSTVTDYNLTPTTFNRVKADLQDQIDKALQTIQTREAQTQTFLTRAAEAAQQAEASRDEAMQAYSRSQSIETLVQQQLTSTVEARARAETSLQSTTALATTAETAAAGARISEDMAYRWAEKMDGPVFVPSGGDPVDDGFYSSKWWARYAQRSTEFGSYWYLGPQASAPTTDRDGNPLQGGMWYFDLTLGVGYIWDDASVPAAWRPMTAASLVDSVFGRRGDVVATEADYQAFYPLKAPTEAHIASRSNPHEVTWTQLLGKPATFPPSTHTHTESEITNLDKYTKAQVDALVAPKLDQAQVDARIPAIGDPRYTRYSGTWGPGTYQPNQIVSHDEGTWLAIAQTTEEPGPDATGWVALGSGGASVFIGETPPVDPEDGDLWLNTTANSYGLYAYYNDGDSRQWVQTNGSGGATTVGTWTLTDNNGTLEFRSGNTLCMVLSPTGDLTVTGDITAFGGP